MLALCIYHVYQSKYRFIIIQYINHWCGFRKIWPGAPLKHVCVCSSGKSDANSEASLYVRNAFITQYANPNLLISLSLLRKMVSQKFTRIIANRQVKMHSLLKGKMQMSSLVLYLLEGTSAMNKVLDACIYVTPGGQSSTLDTRTIQEPKLDRRHSAGAGFAKSSLLVLPCRVPCEVGTTI